MTVKATIKKEDGTLIVVEGSSEEVTQIIKKISGGENVPTPKRKSSGKNKERRGSVIDQISSLIDGGFFRPSKDLVAIKYALAEIGHTYPSTALSPALIRLVRRKELQRVKKEKRWMYYVK